MADVVITMTSDVAKVIRDLEKTAAKQQLQIDKMKATTAASKDSDRTIQEGSRSSARAIDNVTKASDDLLQSLMRIGPGFSGAMGAVEQSIQFLIQSMREANAEADQVADRMKGSAQGLAGLSGVSATPQEYLARTEKARQLFEQGVGQNVGEAADMLTALINAGAEDQADLLGKLQSHGVVADAADMARAMKQMIQTMGTEETGGFEALINKAMAAQEMAPDSADRLIAGAAEAGAGAAQLGISDEEILAATAFAGTAAGSSQRGGTQIKALLDAFQRHPELYEGDLRKSVEELNRLGPEMIEELGSTEAVSAAAAIGEAIANGTFETLMQKIEAGQGQPLAERKAEQALLDPAVRESLEARRAASGLEVARERRGTVALEWETLNSELQKTIEENFSGLSQALISALITTFTGGAGLVGREESLKRLGMTVDPATGQVTGRDAMAGLRQTTWDVLTKNPFAQPFGSALDTLGSPFGSSPPAPRTKDQSDVMSLGLPEQAAEASSFERAASKLERAAESIISMQPLLSAITSYFTKPSSRPQSVVPANRAQQAVATE